jgi:hypothetical protein
MCIFRRAVAAQTVGETLIDSLGMEFILIPAGSFIMGSGADDPEALEDEKPAHRVTIGRPFYLSAASPWASGWPSPQSSGQGKRAATIHSGIQDIRETNIEDSRR